MSDLNPFVVFLLAIVVLFVVYQIYASLYFNSEKFKSIKESISKFTSDCNSLNEHIEYLKSSYSEIKKPIDYGSGNLLDDSVYNMRRSRWSEEIRSDRVHNCSSSVVKNASTKPFKYLCKYFNLTEDEKTLIAFEQVLNDFSSAEEGKFLLKKQRDDIIASISDSIPTLIVIFSGERLARKLGFKDIDLTDLYFPIYTFQYVSAGGNSSSKFDIKLDVDNIGKFVTYLSELVKFRKSIAGQRALMSSTLREKIKIRDGYTCKFCNASVEEEKNLLLEIDHIIPLAKGGITSETNLQTLCWRCNRTKGSKIISSDLQAIGGLQESF